MEHPRQDHPRRALLLLIVPAAAAAVRCDATVNRTMTLQHAIDQTASGDTICFEAGTAYGCEGWGGEGANITGKNLTLTTAPNAAAALKRTASSTSSTRSWPPRKDAGSGVEGCPAHKPRQA